MARSGSVGLCFGVVSVLLLFALDLGSGREHQKKDSLTEKSREVDAPSQCVLSCTARTYKQMLGRGDARTVRFHTSAAGELGEHCWQTQTNHGSGERLRSAYVVLPVDVAHSAKADLGLQPTVPFREGKLKPQNGELAVSDECGLRFDVTGPYGSGKNPSTFCAKIVPQQNDLVRDLRCPPFLVTVWLKQHHAPTS